MHEAGEMATFLRLREKFKAEGLSTLVLKGSSVYPGDSDHVTVM